MCANEINGTCVSASTSRGGGYVVFRGKWVSKFFFLARSAKLVFPPPKSEYFSATLGIRLFFWERKHIPPSWKLIGRFLKIKNQKGIKTVLNYLPKTSFGVVVRRRDFVSLTLSSSPLFSLVLLSHKKILHQNCNKHFFIKFFEWDKLLVFFFQTTEYLVKWEHFALYECTWEPKCHLPSCITDDFTNPLT